MKPGNLFIKVPNPAARRKDEELIGTHIGSLRCAVFFCKGINE